MSPINPKTFELRNLLGHRPADVKFSCGVCGKPNATTVHAKELPLHKQALAEDWAGTFKRLSKILGEKLGDFAERKQFNAQLESMRDKLTQAREEHDAMPPVVKAEKGSAKTVKLLLSTLKMLGVETSEAPHTELATRLHEEVSKLMGIKAEVEAIAPVPVQDEIPTLDWTEVG